MRVARHELTVRISEELVSALQDMAELHDSSLTEEIKRAIQDRRYLSEKVAAGNQVVLERHDSGTKVRTLVDLR